MTDLLEETGDGRADAALSGLARLGALPVSAHADVFEEVFTGLEHALSSVDDRTSPPSGAAADPDEDGDRSRDQDRERDGDGDPGRVPARADAPGERYR
ncbi:hypothetical protein [Streptosporangium sp. NPDC023615]|uniref:hypothetical protein n=1 Tax=Streptosporangium sp. NPDC023615 TaxID=3154794 RepID=UPI00342BD4BF